MALSGSGAHRTVFKHKGHATISQANPVSGTKYTLLDTTKNVRIISMCAWVTWTVQPTPLELHVTIDGVAIIHTQANPVSATVYYPSRNDNALPAGQAMGVFGGFAQYMPFFYEGRSVKIEVETTGGTVSNLSAFVHYAQAD